ncbi:adenosylcobinamide-GDP ribazoletransferase [Bacillus massilinigeriensis]|uniref:adenosylcobinamide-GDP ribazoletransferase n=1 Tax=Bacillus mediterraneensis TaxID=1805474 RepID=UPI0008F805B4|nr:adenosylcobinamide-GDP ribazoletransferase [Bacillus mediterraneensis]
MLKGFLVGIQFFTSIPVPFELPMDRVTLNKAMKLFPIVGLLLGGIFSGLLYSLISYSFLSSLAVSFIVWLLWILLTGGIHLDGWIDCSDAFFSYRDREKRLEIMKDPRTGAFGVLSVIVLLAAKFLFIYEIVTMIRPESYILIAFIPLCSRMVMGVLMITVPSAKKDGLGEMFKKASGNDTFVIYTFYAVLFAFLMLSQDLLAGALAFIIISLAMILFLNRKVKKWFGGITGDVLGATVEGSELILWMTLWLLHYSVTG